LAGKPLIVYAIEAASQSGVFDKICVSSDDEKILRIASEHGAHSVLKRPPELSTDQTRIVEVCAHILEEFSLSGMEYIEFCLTLPTSPLRNAGDLRAAYELLMKENTDTVMSLTPHAHPPQQAMWVKPGQPYASAYFGIKYMKRSQETDKLYQHDGSVIFSRVGPFMKHKNFHKTRIFPYVMPVERSVDVDSPIDLKWAEFLLERNAHG
jgi:CMP-N-acetylneuraminic acid synthetase